MTLYVKDVHFNSLIPELSVSDLNKSLDFYIRILGFKIEYERKSENFAFLSIDGAQVMIEQDNGNWLTATADYPRGRGVNFQFFVSDIDPIIQRLKANNLSLFLEPDTKWRQTGEQKTGQIEFLVQDPDGYLLRFCKIIKGPLGEVSL